MSREVFSGEPPRLFLVGDFSTYLFAYDYIAIFY